VPGQIRARDVDIEVGAREDDDEEETCLDEDQIEKIRCLAQNKLKGCSELIRCKSAHLRHQSIEQDEQTVKNDYRTGSCSSLAGGQVSITEANDRYELANSTLASSTSTSPTSLQSSSPPSSSSSSDSSSSIEDADDEDEFRDDTGGQGIEEIDDKDQVDDDEVEDEEEIDDEDSSEEDDEIDENDDDSDDDECEDIVDPVGNSLGQCNPSFMSASIEYKGVTKATNPIIDQNEEFNSDEEEEYQDDDDDVSFDENDDSDDASDHIPKNSMIDTSVTSDLLDSERMLEVTRKLVRSTERDPDRDLRKQVLLKTAIRKLPHFMEYNPYPESFDQSFQLHSNDMSCNPSDNSSVNLSTAQYYEHHHLHMNHHVDSQPKSYYHSVQPNAIQMSTTSLRMLDLNDDHESEPTSIIDPEQQQQQQNLHHHPQITNYVANNEIDTSLQTSLDQRHQHNHDYQNHSQTTLNMYHYSHQSADSHHNQQHITNNDLGAQTNQGIGVIVETAQDNHDRIDQALSVSQFTKESGTNMIANHDTIDGLYQPMSSSDVGDSDVSAVVDDSAPIAFPLGCSYTGVDVIQETDDTNAIVQSEHKGCFDDNKTYNNLDELRDTHSGTDASSANKLQDVIDTNLSHESNQRSNCHQDSLTSDTSYFSDDPLMVKTTDETQVEHVVPAPITSENADRAAPEIAHLSVDNQPILSGIANSDGNSNSSTSSTGSDDCFLTIPKSNNPSDTISNTSILETSLGSVNEYHHSSYDSGVALFSPRSNKRSSSSIGLDDEMEIDHLNDLSSTSHHNSNVGFNVNHCKKLRKRETID